MTPSVPEQRQGRSEHDDSENPAVTQGETARTSTRFYGFTDAELKVIDNALSFASSEGELTWEETKELGYELSGEQARREGWSDG